MSLPLAGGDVMEPGKLVDRGEADSRWKGRISLGVIGGRPGGNDYANRHSRGSESRTCHRVADAEGALRLRAVVERKEETVRSTAEGPDRRIVVT